MENYDIRYDDKYGQLTHIDLAAEGALHDPWVNQTLTTVNDCAIRLAVIEGRLVDWHKHEHEDEFFLVLEGRLELEVEGSEPFVLGPKPGGDDPARDRAPAACSRTHPRANGRASDSGADRE
jgi:mannose-6-phosphate isomerase-like protein (cupin superfamily)